VSELWHSFLTNTGRVAHKWTHYFPIYERHFARFQDTSCLVVEIGCGRGGSLQMWKRYFGPNAHVVGLDLEPRCKEFEEDQIDVFIGDQSSPEFLTTVIDAVGAPDVVIDDGSHRMEHVAATFQLLYPKVAKNGIYLVEDLHTAYWEEYGGGYRKSDTFIERCKSLVDSLNAYHARGAIPVDEFARTTMSMHFYDSVVVFEKGVHGRPYAPRVGAGDWVLGQGPDRPPDQAPPTGGTRA
jgi:SAM-dependent methyltransferase